MKELSKVIGIVSWLPDNENDRAIRITVFNKLLKQINDYFPEIPLIIIAQNWKNDTPIILNDAKVYHYNERLGILKARKTLIKTFLYSTEKDYLIMFDDDCVIKCTTEDAYLQYLKAIDNHPDGFAFLKGDSDDAKSGLGSPNPYKDSCLNLCAISRKILLENPMPKVNPEESIGFEDRVFSMLLHVKCADSEFDIPSCIDTAHFHDPNIPSTWARRKKYKWKQLRDKTVEIERYILNNGKLPQGM